MLTRIRNLRQPRTGSKRQVSRWRKLAGLFAALSLAAPSLAFCQNGAGYSPQTLNQQVPIEQPGMRGYAQQSPIQQVQSSPQMARAVHHLIEDMPQSSEELEIIQQRSQLIRTKANLSRIAIADPAILEFVQYGPREFALVGGTLGSTTFTIWFEGHPEPLIFTVRTIRDPNYDNQRKLDYGKLERKLALLFPNSKVYLQPISRKILVRGQAKDATEAAHIIRLISGEIINQEGSLFGPQAAGLGIGGMGGAGAGIGVGGLNAFDLAASFIINELQVPGEFQISLRVRIAELERSSADAAGVNINAIFAGARDSLNSAIGAASGAGIGTVSGVGTGGTLSGTFENGEIGIFLNWLCSNGTAKILAEPNATVLSGRNVRFLSGGEFAVPTVVGLGGAQATTTSFRGFGSSLLATPTIIDRDNIRIGVIAEYSNIENQNTVGGIPGLQTRRIETVVEMREGQTIALAGLLSNRTNTIVQRIPLLGDIPCIGPLFFSNKTSTQDENELLILITPEIVRPMDPHEVPPVPGFDVTVPNCEQFWKYNMTEGPPDTGYYHSAPYGSNTRGTNVDYQHFNPGPAGSMYSPIPTNPGPVPGQGYPPGPGYQQGPGYPPGPGYGPGPGMSPPPGYGPAGVPGVPGPTSAPQFNGTTQYRQPNGAPQAANSRSSGQRNQRQKPRSQVIPAGNTEVRQTSYSTPPGSPRGRRYGQQADSSQQ